MFFFTTDLFSNSVCVSNMLDARSENSIGMCKLTDCLKMIFLQICTIQCSHFCVSIPELQSSAIMKRYIL